ncbi:MAG TPA: PspC domain-containing protein [Candidatus Lustribacter sp.]|nr:PspC domain-containing protein [Candidatus Lustribacter sp.]
MESIHKQFREQGLVRPTSGRILGGVCAGVARRFNIDPWAARALFFVTLVLIPGSQILIYPILWVFMPDEAAPVAPYTPPQTQRYEPQDTPPPPPPAA